MPQPSEWPRNVPDIDLDEDYLLPGAIVYEDEEDAGDAEELAKIKAAKRARIEANAQAYLRGEGIFILSASLRGPFDAGWKNPWATKKRKWKHEVVGEDTAMSRAQKILRAANGGSQTPWKSDYASRPVRPNQFVLPDELVPHVPSTPSVPSVSVKPYENARLRHANQPTPEQKAESWLRRNSALSHQQSYSEPTSPTPRKQLSPVSRRRASKPAWTPTKQVITVSSQDVKAPVHQPDMCVADSFETVVAGGKERNKPAHAHSRLQIALEAASPATARKRPRSPDVGMDTQTNRAETAIMRMKRRMTDADKAIANTISSKKQAAETFKTAGSAAERTFFQSQYRANRGRRRNPKISADTIVVAGKRKKPEAAIGSQSRQGQSEKQDSLQLSPKDEQSLEQPTMLPISTVASEASTNLPPSAQPRPELQNSVSNISSATLLSKVVESTTEHASSTSACLQLYGNARSVSKSRASDRDRVDQQSPGICREALVSAKSSCREYRASKTSPGLPLAEEKSVNENGNDKVPEDSPLQLRKARASNKRKSASFAADPISLPMNGSIKSALKIQKVKQPSDSFSHKSSPTPIFDAPSMDMNTSAKQLNPSPPHVRSVLHSPSSVKKRPVRSIFKPRVRLASTAAAGGLGVELSSKLPKRTLVSACSSHDLLASGQNGVVREDDEVFDLDGAINEMGSFLSTWEEEQGRPRAS